MDHPSSSAGAPPPCDDTKTHDTEPASAAASSAGARRPVSVRFSDDEFRLVGAAAVSHGQPPSRFVRQAVLRAAGQPLPPIAARRDALAREIGAALGLLGRIASSANQIARAANGGAVRPRARQSQPPDGRGPALCRRAGARNPPDIWRLGQG